MDETLCADPATLDGVGDAALVARAKRTDRALLAAAAAAQAVEARLLVRRACVPVRYGQTGPAAPNAGRSGPRGCTMTTDARAVRESS